MDKFHSRYGKNIWLTEYACHSFTGKGKCSSSQALAFMKTIAKHCESKTWCETHMIYGSFINSRTGVSKVNAIYSSSSGSMTSLGKAYLTI
ncbi:hypothetical protein BKA62DRAFT_724551 [Auriculariales sp. MPI-PUGE-AT-0066]|nr:hypothetical protein BKA62DRAFT_724551 [Auriculariales sp. MPI-PUGE-AT-0066]